MPELWGRTYSPDALARLVGDMSQLAGVRLSEWIEGDGRGVRVAEVHNGLLSFTVLLDRGLDIGAAHAAGRALAWHSATGWVNPNRYEPEGTGWVRTWGGGLMTGCGLSWMGAPTVDEGQPLGLHGRMSHLAAFNVSSGARWEGDDYVIWVQGEIVEAVTFGDKLHLTRRISTRLGAPWLHIHDRVQNAGFAPAPHMMLYHVNFGFPVVSPDSVVLVDDFDVRPRNETAAKGYDAHRRFQEPTPGYVEQVFFHTVRPDDAGYARAAIVNRALDFGAYVRYRQAELPCLIQWKMMGERDYVCGLEPGNAWVDGRDKARAEGQLRILQPQEVVEYSVEIGALPTRAAIEGYEA